MHEMELGNLIFGNSRGQFPIDRETFNELFHEFLRNINFDSYGVHDIHGYNGFENKTFVIRPYYWGDDDNFRWLPNFVHKPTGLEIQWYKYPLRDSYSNIELTKDMLIKIMDSCVASFYSDKINVLSEGE